MDTSAAVVESLVHRPYCTFKHLFSLLITVVSLLLSVSVAAAQGVYTSIAFPGATSTLAFGINTSGHVVGEYFDTSGDRHGFVMNGKTFETVDYPGAAATSAQAINDQGQIVGWAQVSVSSDLFGWICDTRTGQFQEVSYPSATYTVPLSINNSGTVAGYFQIIQGNNVSTYGFEEVGSQYTSISAPRSQVTYITGVSGAGVLVGYAGGAIYENFSLYDGRFRPLRVPDSQPEVNGVNFNANSVAGEYILNGQSAGFVYAKNNFQTLLFPNAINTWAFGVNASGVVVGYFETQEVTEGFIWTPPAE